MKLLGRALLSLLTGITFSLTSMSVPADAAPKAKAHNGSATFSTSSWSVIAGANAASTLTGSNYTASPAALITCSVVTQTYTYNTTNKFEGLDGVNQIRVYVVTPNSLAIGMIVSGTGIKNSGTNTIVNIEYQSGHDNRITLADGPNTSVSGTTLTFTSSQNVCTTTYESFFSVNNVGSLNVSSINFQQTITSTSGGSMSILSCNIGGVGTSSAIWNESTGLCAGTMNTILLTTRGASLASATSSITGYSLPINSGQSRRLKIISSQASRSSSISVSISVSLNLRNLVTHG